MNTDVSVAAINEIIAMRRSVKPEDFDTTRKVPREIVENMLANANWAPTHAYTEPWRFKVFASPESLKDLGLFEAEYYKSQSSADTFNNKKYEKAQQRPLYASYVIAIYWKRQANEAAKIIPETEEIAAVACAVMNMWLTATAYGVSCFWGTGGSTYSGALRNFLALQHNEQCLGFLYVGYAAADAAIKAGRRVTAITEKAVWL